MFFIETVIASNPVSYTHLDVYKRQSLYSVCIINIFVNINVVIQL